MRVSAFNGPERAAPPLTVRLASGMPHLREPLVGRGAELAALEETLAAARRGFVAVELLGEPGMGKTRLTGLAVASGPVIGGAVAQGLAWQWIFWINVPIGRALLVAFAFSLAGAVCAAALPARRLALPRSRMRSPAV
jgi:MFS family permease